MALAVLDRAEQRVAEERAARRSPAARAAAGTSRGRGRSRARAWRGTVEPLPLARRRAAAELARLERAARLVVGSRARRRHGDRAARAGAGARRRRLGDARAATRSASSKSSSSRKPGSSAQTKRPCWATSPLTASPRSASPSARLDGVGLPRSRRRRRTSVVTRPPRPNGSSRRASSEPASSPATSLGEHVAGQPALGRVGDAAAQQLERDDGDRLVQDQAVELGEAAGVLDRDQPRLRQPAVGARARPTGSASARGASSGCAGRSRAPRRGARARAARRRARRRPRRSARGGSVCCACELAAAVEDERRRRRSARRARAAIASRPRSQSTMRCRRSCAAIERCSSAYCSLTRRAKACSVTAMNGVS